MKLAKTCLTWLAIYAFVAIATGLLVYRHIPEKNVAVPSGIFGGFALWIGFAFILGLGHKIREVFMIRRAMGGDPPRDGKPAAAIGRINATGPMLRSPLTDTPCLAYKYRISGGGEDDNEYYDGFALTPSGIQTPSGVVRLLVYPELKWNPAHPDKTAAMSTFLRFMADADFRHPTQGKLHAGFADMAKDFHDDDGSVNVNHRTGDHQDDLSGAIYREWVLKAGDKVCVIGKYSAQKNGIVPDPENPLQQVTIQLGEPESFSGRTIRSAIAHVVGITVFAGGTLIALAGMYAFVPLAAAESMSPSSKPTWLEVRLERLMERKVRPPLRRAGMLDNSTISIPDMPLGSARGRIETPSGEIKLTTAEASLSNGQTTIRIGGNAIVLTVSANKEPVALYVDGHLVPFIDIDLEITGQDENAVAGRLTVVCNSENLSVRTAFRARIIPS